MDDLISAHRTLAALSFKHFVGYFWPLICNEPLVPGYHTDAIIEHLHALAPDPTTGQSKIKRLAILCPCMAELAVIE